MFRVELLAIAEDELSDAYAWYEKEQPNLGDRFYKEVNQYLSLLENTPLLFAIRYPEELRSVPLKIFPFLIIYWVDEENRVVYVTAIFHTSRMPRY